MVDLRRMFLAIQLAAARFHPFDFNLLTADGVQYTDEYTTSTDAYEEAFIAKSDYSLPFEVHEAYFELAWAMKSSGAAEAVTAKWQIRTKHGTWFDLCDPVTYPADASAYLDHTVKGYVDIKDTTCCSPAEIRLMIKSDAAGGETAICKVKNTTEIRFIPKMLKPVEYPI